MVGGREMYFREYIFNLFFFSIASIVLSISLCYLLYQIVMVKMQNEKKKIEVSNWSPIFIMMVGAMTMVRTIPKGSIFDVSISILFFSVGIHLYQYNFILKDGMFIKGRFIPWSRMENWDYKKDYFQVIEISYLSGRNSVKPKKVTFSISKNFGLELENTLRDKIDNRSHDISFNADKFGINKGIKISLAMILVLSIAISMLGVYRTFKFKSINQVLKEAFKHTKTSSVEVWYEDKNTEGDEYGRILDSRMTGRENKIEELHNYFDTFQLGRIQYKDLSHDAIMGKAYRIVIWQLNGESTEIIISKDAHLIELTHSRKTRSYFIYKGPENLEFINIFGESID